MSKKKDREIIFNKFGGRCAYCGCELQKGWHVDELLPIVRLKNHRRNKDGSPITDKNYNYVFDITIKYPERLNINNKMNQDNYIPVAIPINTHTDIGYIDSRIKTTQINNTNDICKDCRQPFSRKLENKGSSTYFRCENCSKTQLTRSCVNRCLVL